MHTNKKVLLAEIAKQKKEKKKEDDKDALPDNTPKLIAYMDYCSLVGRFF